jgi:hypothetical protein
MSLKKTSISAFIVLFFAIIACDSITSPTSIDIADAAYTITYMGNGNDGGTAPQPQTKSEGVDVTVSTSGDLTRAGFLFTVWNTKADGSGDEYKTGSTYTTDADVTLYAMWEEIATSDLVVTVVYKENGAVGGTVPVDSQYYNEGDTITVLDNTGNLTKTASAFIGWSSEPTGSTKIYLGGDTITAGTEDVTLYAQWWSGTIGDTGPAGGIVFYDKGSYSDGWRFLEAAVTDASAPVTGNYITWGGYGTLTGANGTAIGTGSVNTQTIVSKYGASDPYSGLQYAAKVCTDYTSNGFSDWFLPSIDELEQLFNNRTRVGNFISEDYWSSSEYNSSRTYFFDFNSGFSVYNGSKDIPSRVRPIRSF